MPITNATASKQFEGQETVQKLPYLRKNTAIIPIQKLEKGGV